VITLCRYFGPGVLPSHVLSESAEVLRQVAIYELWKPEEGGEFG
jgi:hypothetical protein